MKCTHCNNEMYLIQECAGCDHHCDVHDHDVGERPVTIEDYDTLRAHNRVLREALEKSRDYLLNTSYYKSDYKAQARLQPVVEQALKSTEVK